MVETRSSLRAIIQAMATIRISESDLARDVPGVLAKVRQGDEVIVEDDRREVAVIKSPRSAGPGRKLSECIALAKAHEARLGSAPLPDDDFAEDVRAAVEERRDAFLPPEWD